MTSRNSIIYTSNKAIEVCKFLYLALVVGSNGLVILELELISLGYIGSLVLQSTNTCTLPISTSF